MVLRLQDILLTISTSVSIKLQLNKGENMSESHLESIGSQRIERLVQFRVKPDADLLRMARPEPSIFFSNRSVSAMYRRLSESLYRMQNL